MLGIINFKNRFNVSSYKRRFILSVISIGTASILIPLSFAWFVRPLEIGLIAPLSCLFSLIIIQLLVIRRIHLIETDTRQIKANFSEFLRVSAPSIFYYDLLFLCVSFVTFLLSGYEESLNLLIIVGNMGLFSLVVLILNWSRERPLPGGKLRELNLDDYPIIRHVIEQSGLQIHSIGFLPLEKLKIINAYQWGARKNAVIAISDYLEQILSSAEVAGVVAHELGHIKNNHFAKQIVSLAISPLILINFYYMYNVLDIYQYLNEFGQIMLLAILGFLALGVPILVIPWITRRWEVKADLYAANLVGSEVIASALRKLVDNEAVHWDVDKRIEFLLSHPSIRKRVDIVRSANTKDE